MSRSVEGIFLNGVVQLTEQLMGIPDSTRVIVTFLEPGLVDLQAQGIDADQAHDLRTRLGAFKTEWDSPEMDIYDDYDTSKAAP
jgi:hypothetical protein